MTFSNHTYGIQRGGRNAGSRILTVKPAAGWPDVEAALRGAADAEAPGGPIFRRNLVHADGRLRIVLQVLRVA